MSLLFTGLFLWTSTTFASPSGPYTCDGTHGIYSAYLLPGKTTSIYINGAPVPKVYDRSSRKYRNAWMRWYLVVWYGFDDDHFQFINGEAHTYCER